MICQQCENQIYEHSQGPEAGTIEWLVDEYGCGFSETIRASHRACNYYSIEIHKTKMISQSLFDRWLPLFEFKWHREIYQEQLWNDKTKADNNIRTLLEAR